MLSIIIPIYNAEKTIEKCINSIITADKKNPNIISEVIAIDDGSSDNSILLLNQIASQYKKLNVISQENKGAGGTRNKGLNEAKSKFISFVDSDDYVHRDYLSPLLENNNSSIISFNILKKSKSSSDSVILPGETSGSMVSAFFYKSIFIENNLLIPENINYKDNAISFIVWTLNKDSRTHIDKELYIYQHTSTSQSNTKSKHHLFSRMESTTYLQDKAKSLGLFEKHKSELGEMTFKLDYIPALSLCFRGFSNYSTYIKKPSNTPFKKQTFYFCVEHMGYIGYLLICLKRLNKIYR